MSLLIYSRSSAAYMIEICSAVSLFRKNKCVYACHDGSFDMVNCYDK